MELRSAVSAAPTPAQNSVCRTVDNTHAGYNFPQMFENPAVPHERYSPNDGATGLVSSTFENCVVNNVGQYSGGGNSHVGGVPDTTKNIKNSYFNCVVNNVSNGLVPSELLPSGNMPSGHMPCGLMPSGNMPGGLFPSGLIPSGTMPSELVPSGLLPSGLLPSGLLPSGFMPSALMPNASNNHESAANFPNSALNKAVDTRSKKTAMLAIEDNQRAVSTVLKTDTCALSKFHQTTKRLTDRATDRVQRLRAETMERAKEGRARSVEDKRHASMLAIEGKCVGETFKELEEQEEKNDDEHSDENKEKNIEEKEKDDKVNEDYKEGQEGDAGKKKNGKMRKRGATRSRKRMKAENIRSLNPSTSIGVITMSFPNDHQSF